MSSRYNHKKVEGLWQEKWESEKVFKSKVLRCRELATLSLDGTINACKRHPDLIPTSATLSVTGTSTSPINNFTSCHGSTVMKSAHLLCSSLTWVSTDTDSTKWFPLRTCTVTSNRAIDIEHTYAVKQLSLEPKWLRSFLMEFS